MSRISGPLNRARPQRLKHETSAERPKGVNQTSVAGTTPRALGFSAASSFLPTSPSRIPGQASLAPRKLSPNDLGVLAQDQGNTNACGTTSLANVMTYWGMPRTHEQIDNSIRAFDLFSAPDKLVDYARAHGLRAELKADANLNDIARMVDQGVPPIVLVDPDSDSNINLHYMTVTGYTRDANGQINSLAIADSAGGYRYTMPASEFQKQWDKLKLANIGTGLNNVMITTVPSDGRMITGGDGVSRRASDIQLPRSSLLSSFKSGITRRLGNFISNSALFIQKGWSTLKAAGNAVGSAAKAVGNAVKKTWKSIFG